jgi:V8-like Glu-specific endopeptidase
MVIISSLLLATGLGLTHAIPTSGSTNTGGTFVPSIKYLDTTSIQADINTEAIIPRPEIIQLTPDELDAWTANASSTADPPTSSPTKEKRGVIGTDERHYQSSGDFPYGSMGRVTIYVNNQPAALCSGTLVGPRLMAAARHCIISNASGFKFSPGYQSGDRFPTAFATQVVSLTKNDSLGVCDLMNDWALFVLDQPLGVQRGYLWIGDYAADESFVAGQPILYNAGYPGDRDNAEKLYMSDSRTSNRPYKSQCANGGPIIADCDVAAGMSGGPLWRRKDNDRWTYGNLFGAFFDNNGNELSSIHSHGPSFIKSVHQLNDQHPN